MKMSEKYKQVLTPKLPTQRGCFMQSLSKVTRNILYKTMSPRYSPYFIEILMNWDKIAGSFSDVCYPTKIDTYKEKNHNKNKLYVEVLDSSCSMQRLYFHKGVLIERIGFVIGYTLHDISFKLNLEKLQ